MPKLGNTIVKVVSADVDSFSVTLIYANSKRVTVSLDHVFRRPIGLAAEVLAGGMFENCFAEAGALAWPNGLELCPDMLYSHLLALEDGGHRAATKGVASEREDRVEGREVPVP